MARNDPKCMTELDLTGVIMHVVCACKRSPLILPFCANFPSLLCSSGVSLTNRPSPLSFLLFFSGEVPPPAINIQPLSSQDVDQNKLFFVVAVLQTPKRSPPFKPRIHCARLDRRYIQSSLCGEFGTKSFGNWSSPLLDWRPPLLSLLDDITE